MYAMISWKVKPAELERELELLATTYEELQSVKPDGLAYTTFQLDDKVSFVAIARMDGGPAVMHGLKAFQDYRSTLEQRCDESPVVTVLREVGTYSSY